MSLHDTTATVAFNHAVWHTLHSDLSKLSTKLHSDQVIARVLARASVALNSIIGGKRADADKVKDLAITPRPGAIVAYTDGSADKGHAKCGAGLWISGGGGPDPTAPSSSFAVPLGAGSNNVGELYALGLAFDVLRDRVSDSDSRRVLVFSDSAYSIGTTTRGWGKGPDLPLIRSVRGKYRSLNAKLGCEVELYWIRGHDGIPGNSAADALAGDAMSRSDQGDERRVEVAVSAGIFARS